MTTGDYAKYVVVVDLTPLASVATARSCRYASVPPRHSPCTLFAHLEVGVLAAQHLGLPEPVQVVAERPSAH